MIRKYLEKNRNTINGSYKLIKFFADWTVHTEKTKNIQDIRSVLTDIEMSLIAKNFEATLVNTIQLESLKDELKMFMKSHNIKKNIIWTTKCWRRFCINLFKILQDSPLINLGKGNGINKIQFEYYTTVDNFELVHVNIELNGKTYRIGMLN